MSMHMHKQEWAFTCFVFPYSFFFVSPTSLTSTPPFALENRLTGYYNGKQFCTGNRFIRVAFFSLVTTAIFLYLSLLFVWFCCCCLDGSVVYSETVCMGIWYCSILALSYCQHRLVWVSPFNLTICTQVHLRLGMEKAFAHFWFSH